MPKTPTLEIDPDMRVVKFQKVLKKLKAHNKKGEFPTFEMQQQVRGYVAEQKAIVFQNTGEYLGLRMAQRVAYHQGPLDKEDRALLAASTYLEIDQKIAEGDDPFLARGRFIGVLKALKCPEPLVERAIKLVREEFDKIK